MRKDKYDTNLFIWIDSVATVNQINDSLNLSMLYYPNYRTKDGNNNPITANFIAGSVETYQTFSYGVYECKANFANQRGSFPAFWLMSKMPCSTSYNNEIDIVELKREDDSPTLDNNIFYWPTNCNPNREGHGFKANPFTWGQPHTFKCIWSPSKIEYFVDNTLLHTVQNTGQTQYPQLPQRIILSQQITMYNTTYPIYGIVTPQTSNFHWVKYREFFLAPEITVPSLICSSGTAVLDVAPAADSITWKLTPTNLFTGAKSDTGKIATITASSGASGQGKITYTFKMPSNEIFTAEKTFWVGKPVISEISGPTTTPNNQWTSFTAQLQSDLSSPTDYNWILNPLNGNMIYDYGATCDVAFYNSGYYQIVVQAKNTCPDWGPYYVGNVEVYDDYYIAISPNPTTGETTLSIESTSKENSVNMNEEWDLEIYDQIQTLKEKKTKLKGNEYKIQTAGWKEGVYFVRVKYKDEILTGQLVVKQ